MIWITQSAADPDVRASSKEMLNGVLPVLLRFLADEYDDTSSAVFPLISGLLAMVRHHRSPKKKLSLSSSSVWYIVQTTTKIRTRLVGGRRLHFLPDRCGAQEDEVGY